MFEMLRCAAAPCPLPAAAGWTTPFQSACRSRSACKRTSFRPCPTEQEKKAVERGQDAALCSSALPSASSCWLPMTAFGLSAGQVVGSQMAHHLVQALQGSLLGSQLSFAGLASAGQQARPSAQLLGSVAPNLGVARSEHCVPVLPSPQIGHLHAPSLQTAQNWATGSCARLDHSLGGWWVGEGATCTCAA